MKLNKTISIFVILMLTSQLAFGSISIRDWKADVLLHNNEAVVNIANDDGSQMSGFFIGNHGYIISLAFSFLQLPLDKSKITITTASGYKFKPSLVVTHEKLGITVLKIDAEITHYLDVTDKLETGNELVIIGAAGDNAWQKSTVTAQTINQKTFTYSRENAMPGFSGAPIINKAGKVVGIHRGTAPDINGKQNIQLGEGLRIDGVAEYILSLEGVKTHASFKIKKKK